MTGVTVTSAGSGYIYPPEVTITGDGIGARAFAIISGGVITAITVYELGVNYTIASVSIATKPVLNDTGFMFARTGSANDGASTGSLLSR